MRLLQAALPLAAAQHGVVSRRQLIDAGVGGAAIARAVRGDLLIRCHRGVYAVGHPALTEDGRHLAAVLACGDGAVLSHLSAAVAWRMLSAAAALHVTSPGQRGGALPGIHHHRALVLPADRSTRVGIPLTTPERTIADCAALLQRRPLAAMVDRALRRGLIDADRMCRGLVAGRRGARVLRDVLAERGGQETTRSELERRMLGLVRARGLPAPRVNVFLQDLGYEVDLLWAAQGVVVELDGWRFHAGRVAFEADRRRDADLQARGLAVARFTWKQVAGDPAWVADRLTSLLSRSESVARSERRSDLGANG